MAVVSPTAPTLACPAALSFSIGPMPAMLGSGAGARSIARDLNPLSELVDRADPRISAGTVARGAVAACGATPAPAELPVEDGERASRSIAGLHSASVDGRPCAARPMPKISRNTPNTRPTTPSTTRATHVLPRAHSAQNWTVREQTNAATRAPAADARQGKTKALAAVPCDQRLYCLRRGICPVDT